MLHQVLMQTVFDDIAPEPTDSMVEHVGLQSSHHMSHKAKPKANSLLIITILWVKYESKGSPFANILNTVHS